MRMNQIEYETQNIWKDNKLRHVLENIHFTIHKEAIKKVRETKMRRFGPLKFLNI